MKFLILIILQFLQNLQFSNTLFYDRQKYPLFTNETSLSTLNMILHYGFKAESHLLTTDDGYLLTMQRIVNELDPKAPPIILGHGGGSSSRDWLLPLDLDGSSTNSLPFTLSRNGFDVWMYNARGSAYSQGHKDGRKNINSFNYWNFNVDDQARFDIPKAIDYVVGKTGRNITWIGWSLTGILPLLTLSSQPQYNDKVNMYVGFAAAGSIHNLSPFYKFLVKYFCRPEEPLLSLMRIVGPNDHLVGGILYSLAIPVVKFLYQFACNISLFGPICDWVYWAIAGYSRNTPNIHAIIQYWLTLPFDLSTRTFIQVCQKFNAEKALFYDYGQDRNLQIYGNLIPPQYNLSKITVPAAFYVGSTDKFIGYKDALHTASQMPNVIKVERVNAEGWNHLDFPCSYKAPSVLYNPLSNLIKQVLYLKNEL